MEQKEINQKLKRYYDNWEKKKQIVTLFLRTHQRPRYLSLMIDSILKQTYTNYYLIVIDNMSGDNTKEVVESFCDDRIIFLERESNNASHITNYSFCFDVCKTKYLTVFHDDDILSPTYLEMMLKEMNNNNDLTILSCSYDLIDWKGVTLSKCMPTHKLYCYSKTEYTIKTFRGEIYAYVLFPTIMYRVSFFENGSKYADTNAGPSLDDYMCFQIERYGGKIGVLGECLFLYRVHQNQESSQKGWWMGIKLLNYMCKQDYYKDLLLKNNGATCRFIENSIAKTIQKYSQGSINKKDIRSVYSMVPKELTRSNFKLNMKVFLFRFFPGIILFFYIKIKHYN